MKQRLRKKWNSSPSMKQRIVYILITAKGRGKPLTAKELSESSGINRDTVNKYLLQLERKGIIKRFKTAHGYCRYTAADNAETWTELGGVPRYSLSDILDIDKMKYEDRKAQIQLKESYAEKIREQCAEAKKKDRAQWRSYSTDGFSCCISKNGVFRLTVHDVKRWEGVFRQWLQSLKFYDDDIERIISDLGIAFSSCQGRIEIPVKTPLLRESKTELEIITTFDGETIRTNINRSCNELGLEISANNWFIDMVTSELSMYQHKIALEHKASMREKSKDLDYIG